MASTPKTFYEQEIDRLYNDIATPERHYALIRQSKAFMEKHYAKKLELDDLAQAAFMSRFHYVRTFKQLYGLTPRNYLRGMRIAKAKELLKQGHSITDTCADVATRVCLPFRTPSKKVPDIHQESFVSST